MDPTSLVFRKSPDSLAAAKVLKSTSSWQDMEVQFMQRRYQFFENAWGCYEDGNLIGVALWDISILGGFLQVICIHKERQGLGFGTKLLQFVQKSVFSLTPNLFLIAHDTAEDFYLRNDFIRVGPIKNWIKPGDHGMMMRKSIGPAETFERNS